MVRLEDLNVCPFCGASHSITSNGQEFFCNDCLNTFGEDDVVREGLRKVVSLYCTQENATEDEPICCFGEDIEPLVVSDDKIDSPLREPKITRIYHDCECVVWVETDFGDYHSDIELESLSANSLKTIVEWLNDEIGGVENPKYLG